MWGQMKYFSKSNKAKENETERIVIIQMFPNASGLKYKCNEIISAPADRYSSYNT